MKLLLYSGSPAQAIEAEIRKNWSGKRGFCGAKMRPNKKKGKKKRSEFGGFLDFLNNLKPLDCLNRFR
jgi:hypothetical protein